MNAVDFFNTILPAAGLRCMALPTRTGGFRHVFGDSNEWLAEATQHCDVNRGLNVYFGCASFKPQSEWAQEFNEHGKQKERTQANVAYVRSFWADIDCGPGKPYASAREGAAAVLGFCGQLGLPQPFLVASGRGVHAYWPMDGDMVPAVWKTTAQLLKAALKHEGVHADPSRTADEASVLRPPGTHHRKAEPKLVRVVVEGVVSSLAAFQAALLPYAQYVQLPSETDDFLPAGGPAAGFERVANSDLSAGFEYRPASGVLIAQKCGIIQMIRDTGGAVDQPTWYFGLGVLAFTEEGDALCHEWSKGDPRYTQAETDRKLAQIRANQRPTTCEKLGEQHPSVCAACPHRGTIKTPYTLGLVNGETTTVEQQVKTETGWVTRKIDLQPPEGFRFEFDKGRKVMQQSVWNLELNEGKGGWDWVTFCKTVVVPTTRLWIEGVAHVEWEMSLKDGAKRRFVLEGGTIGKGKDTLAAELGRNEVVTEPGKGTAMDAYMKRWLDQLKETSDQVVAHRHFGWADRAFVLGDTVLHPDGTSTRAVLVGMAKSKSAALQPKGDLQTWVQLVDRAYNAPGQEGFQFLVACSFAAPLLSMMQQVNGVTVYAHSEGSGVGKTTASRVGLSAWGNHDDLMLADKKITSNALWGLMGAYSSLPVAYDELTNMTNDVASDLVFSISSGRAKQRMNAHGELRENNDNWCTILQASGNNLLSEKLSLHRANAEAEISRLFEFTLDSTAHLTTNEANALFPQFLENYGHAGRVFAAHVVENYDAVSEMLRKAQASLNTQLGITQVERYWSALLAAALVAVAICRNLGILTFDIKSLRAWMVDRLAENRAQRKEAANDPLELFGRLLAETWEGILVTQGEGDLRSSKIAQTIQKPRGALVGRAILPVKNEKPVLLMSVQAIRDWANRRGVSAKEMHKALVAAGWADASAVRYSLGKGTVEYSQTSTYIPCWKLDPDKIGLDAGQSVAQRFGVINGGGTAGAGAL